MGEIRWNPLLRTYSIVATNRQNRPNMPKGWCPFCPGEGKKVPADYDVHLYDNDFPCMSLELPDLADPSNTLQDPLYHKRAAKGKCEVVLYSPEHYGQLAQLPLPHIKKLVALWKERFMVLKEEPTVQYIFPFENRGAEVGVTMPHPHGQLYAYPFLPLKIKTELDSARDYYQAHKRNLFTDMLEREKADNSRIIFENDEFIAFLPYFTDYPFGAFIMTKGDLASFEDFEDKHIGSLAYMLKHLVGAFDEIYQKPFPYMMCVHQTPVNTPEYADAAQYFRFHIEFYPPLRSETAIKYYASSEMGAWAATNTIAVEESIHIIREALDRFRSTLKNSEQ